MNKRIVLLITVLGLMVSVISAGSMRPGQEPVSFQAIRERLSQMSESRNNNAFGQMTSALGDPKNIPIEFELSGSTLWTGMTDVVVDGNYAYCALAYGLIILDVTQLAGQPYVSKIFIFGASSVAKNGNHVYVATFAGLAVVNVENPHEPSIEGVASVERYGCGVAVVDTFAYLIGDTSLSVVNVANPASPSVVGTCPCFNFPWAVAATEDLVIVADIDTMKVIDVSDKTAPYIQGRCALSATAMDVTIVGKYAYVACRDSGLQVVGLASPTSPTILGKYTGIYQTEAMAIENGYAYVTDYGLGMQILNISDPASPRWVANYEFAGPGFGICISNHRAYIANVQNLLAVNVSKPEHPADAGHFDTPGEVKDVAIKDNYAYVADQSGGLAIVDISNPENPSRISSLLKDAEAVAVYEQRAYFGSTFFWAADVSNPYSPTPVCSCQTSVYPANVIATEKYVYVADAFYGLRIFNGANCEIVSSVPTGTETPRGIALQGNYVYLATVDAMAPVIHSDFHVIDVSTPNSPQELGSCLLPGVVIDVAVSGRFAYVACLDSGLIIVDVLNPARPEHIASNPLGTTYAVEVAGDRLFVSGLGFGIKIFGISSTGLGAEIGGYALFGSAGRLAVSGTHLYVCDEKALAVVRMRLCGDMDGSGDINIADAVYAVNYIFNSGPVPQDMRAGDIDCDGALTIADVVFLVNYIFSGGAEPCDGC